MFTITVSAPVVLGLAVAILVHIGGILAAIAILSFVAMQYRAKRAEDEQEALYARWEAEAEMDVRAVGCYADCGECWTCRRGEEPI
jgi:hypothetical protein